MANIYFIYRYWWEDGSIYIGQSHIGARRYGLIGEYSDSPRVYNKMKKDPNFNKEILVDGLSETEVDDFEIYYIKIYNSFKKDNPKYGLNLTRGGYGSHGCVPWNKGLKGVQKCSKEKKEQQSKKWSGSGNPKSKKVRCIETKEVFDTAKQAAEKYGLSSCSVSNAANPNEKRSTAAGYHWEYIKEE